MMNRHIQRKRPCLPLLNYGQDAAILNAEIETLNSPRSASDNRLPFDGSFCTKHRRQVNHTRSPSKSASRTLCCNEQGAVHLANPNADSLLRLGRQISEAVEKCDTQAQSLREVKLHKALCGENDELLYDLRTALGRTAKRGEEVEDRKLTRLTLVGEWPTNTPQHSYLKCTGVSPEGCMSQVRRRRFIVGIKGLEMYRGTSKGLLSMGETGRDLTA